MSVVKTPEEVEKMRIAGALLSRCLDMLVAASIPGRTALAVDAIAEEFIRDHGAIPAFKNYGKGMAAEAFPASICFSQNRALVHGIPTAKTFICEGDLITVDCGLSLDGWYADAARIFGVGRISVEDATMIESVKAALQDGIDKCVVGNKLGDVCHAIQQSIVQSPFFNVYQFCGHGIGKAMHEEPQVPNFGRANTGIDLEPGMVFCLEPMLRRHKETQLGILPDHWTVVTLDGSRAAHIEHMVLVTENGPEILTQ